VPWKEGGSISLQTWLYAAAAALFGSAGQVLLKLGCGESLMNSLLDWRTGTGVLLYGASFVLWLRVLASWPLSRAYPVLSLNFVLVAVLSAVVLKEPLSVRSMAGTALCVLGVAVLGKS